MLVSNNILANFQITVKVDDRIVPKFSSLLRLWFSMHNPRLSPKGTQAIGALALNNVFSKPTDVHTHS